jgi:PadR family transcriptional regulator, regulatory protein PadR
MSRRRTNPDFLNGVPELLVLRLIDREPMYGYQIVEALRRSTYDALTFGEGSIYPVLHKLARQKLLTGAREVVNGRTRVVYRLTPAGRRRLEQAVLDWEQVVLAVHSVLKGPGDGRVALS